MFRSEGLRAQIKAGVDALDHGAFIEIADAELERYLDGLTAAPDARAR